MLARYIHTPMAHTPVGIAFSISKSLLVLLLIFQNRC